MSDGNNFRRREFLCQFLFRASSQLVGKRLGQPRRADVPRRGFLACLANVLFDITVPVRVLLGGQMTFDPDTMRVMSTALGGALGRRAASGALGW